MKLCFSGHRPNKLFGYEFNNGLNQELRFRLKEKVEEILLSLPDDEKLILISGMALGIDQHAFQVGIELRDKYGSNKVELIAAVPHPLFNNRWFKAEDIERHNYFTSIADTAVPVNQLKGYETNGEEFQISSLQIRNTWMANNSDKAIVIWDGTSGGTANFYRYARDINLDCIILNPKEMTNW